jgi:hypothetical protein
MTDDWRLTGQEAVLSGATLSRQPYRAKSAEWEHDHCAFCWAKFMDPSFSEEHREHIAAHSDVLTEGFTTTAEHPKGAAYYWICETCFGDFRDRFDWRVAPASE